MPDHLSMDEVRTAFTAPIEPVRTTWLYRSGLAAVLLSLILLQAVYLLIVLAVAAATLAYVLAIPAIFSTVRINWITLVLALAPPVIGAITTFFLFKPIFARPPKPPKAPSVTRDQQPELFAFLDKLCECVGSPAPKFVELNLAANASAGLARGFRSLFSDDLKLTIGLPLVQGLSLRQFTGVLAHEFGHFAQKAGMRSWFLIQSIQRWFARVAYERDEWDLKLAEWKEHATSRRVRLIMWLADRSVAASRALLRLLMRLAGFVSSAFSRQMEFDADHYEASVAGIKSFEETTLALPAIALSAQKSIGELGHSWRIRRLPANFPDLVHRHFSRLNSETLDAIRQSTLAEKTERFATHPSPADRLANVQRRPVTPVFTLDGPASRLFRDFPALCHDVTQAHYRQWFGDALDNAQLLTADDLSADVSRDRAFEAARQELFGTALAFAPRWFRLEITAPAAGDVEEPAWLDLLNKLLLQEGAAAIIAAGAKVNQATFRVSSQDDGEIVAGDVAATRAEIARLEQGFRARTATAAARILAALDSEAMPLRDAYDALASVHPDLLELRIQLVRRRLLQGNSEHLGAAACANALDRHDRRMLELTRVIAARLETTESPIVTAGRSESLAQQLFPDIAGTQPSPEDRAVWMLDHSDVLGNKILDRLCRLALNRT